MAGRRAIVALAALRDQLAERHSLRRTFPGAFVERGGSRVAVNGAGTLPGGCRPPGAAGMNKRSANGSTALRKRLPGEAFSRDSIAPFLVDETAGVAGSLGEVGQRFPQWRSPPTRAGSDRGIHRHPARHIETAKLTVDADGRVQATGRHLDHLIVVCVETRSPKDTEVVKRS
jgi:hypothetical protein